jgi:hypothetical protein
MKNLYILFFLLLLSQVCFSQVLEITHQSNGTVLQLPIESIDSVKVNEYNNYFLKTVYQNNGNILGIALQDIDSISYVIPDITSLPTLITIALSQETSNAVFSGGIVLSDGGSPVTQRGVCWNTSVNPTLANSFTIDGAGTGSYTSHAIPLVAATSYFLRSYATNENGTAYGNQLTFTTASSNQGADLPEVVTGELVYEDGLVALGAGTVTIPSGTVSAKGLCWAIGATPTINSSHSVEGAGTGNFTSSIANLQVNTLYRVRAYAASDAGITYGDEVLFRTNDLPQYYSTSLYNYLENNTVSLAMAVNFDGGSEITERGVCWSTEWDGPPTIDDDFSAIGSGEGTFHKTFTNLDPANVYYFRPYATNGIGTSYGPVSSASLENSINLEEDIYPLLYKTYIHSNSHNHFGQKSMDIFSDMLSSDLALSQSTYGWYNNTANLEGTVGSSADARYAYAYYMEIIDRVNPLVTALTPFGSLPSNDEDRWVLGQVLALRGYAYFYLTQFFQEKYNPDEIILPLHTGGQYDNTPVLTSTIYNQVLNDLNSSISLLDNYTSPDKLHVNKTIAQGLLAYTYAAMGNYAAAKPLADAVIASGYPLTTASELVHPGDLSGFNDVNTPSWIWGLDITEEIGLGLVSWWGQMDYYSYSYQAYGDYKAMDASLFAEIPTDDLRKGQFLDDTSFSQHLMPLNKFFDADRVHTGTSTTIKADYLFMRVDEFYLLSAECATRLGNDAEARSTMIPFLDIRIPDAETIVNALSSAELQDFIYLQTKIELWGEGKTYLAMKRNQATITRGTNHLSFVGESFSYDADELTFDMVSLESNYSPPALESLNCGGLVQNGDVLVFQESVTDFTFQIPYVTLVGGDYQAMDINSSGVQGLTASIAAGTFNEFEGMLEFNVTGTPVDYGTATFNINIGGRGCSISFEVVAVENCTAYPTILTINFDENPEQTYWKLFSTSDSSTPLFSGGLDGSYAGMTSIQIPFCLEDGAYVLTFFDTNNDGMNSGGYSLEDIYGTKYACGGSFTEPELTLFTAGVDTVLNDLEIQFGFDSYPEEVYWTLVDVDTEEIVMTSSTTPDYGAYAGMTGGLIVKNCNLPSGNYQFVIYDSYGDGGTSVVLILNGNQIGSIGASSYGGSAFFDFSI